jgi:ankyrin repeat protein
LDYDKLGCFNEVTGEFEGNPRPDNMFGRGKSSALYYAVITANLEMVKFLVENAGANPKIAVASSIDSACDLYFYSHNEDYKEMIRYLVSKGANVNAKEHFTPYECVQLRLSRFTEENEYTLRCKELLELLVELGAKS